VGGSIWMAAYGEWRDVKKVGKEWVTRQQSNLAVEKRGRIPKR